MPRIVVLDTLSPEGLKLLEEARSKGINLEVRTGLKGDALAKPWPVLGGDLPQRR